MPILIYDTEILYGTTYNLGWFKTKEAAVKARFNMEEAVDVNISL